MFGSHGLFCVSKAKRVEAFGGSSHHRDYIHSSTFAQRVTVIDDSHF
jgi:hypothetical protein